tara:strand:+ start:8123 stop:9739 length:1617 start_codon:yes stop_codon:yes gene_type:complete
MAEKNEKAVMLSKRLGSLKSQRATWEKHWQDIADFVVPRKADITKKRSAGEKRIERSFDSTAMHSAELLSASLHGMLTNPSTPWFTLRFVDDELDGNDEANEWLQGAEKVLYRAFARSNFQEQIHELYHDLVVFGTGVMFVEEDDEFMLRFSTRHISECYLSENEHGRVDTVYREFRMPARAAVNRFGKNKVSQKFIKAANENPYEMVTVCHAVFFRDTFDRTKYDSANKPVASIYFDAEEGIILSESGFDEFPYMAPRFLKSSFEIGYGRSVAMVALPDIQMLSAMSQTTIRAAQKQVDPPLLVPDDGFMLPIRTVPGGLNFYRSGTRDRLEPLNIGANNPLGLNMEDQRRKAIQSAFYVDQLILGGGPQMTATEVVQRTEEKMRILGPVLGRLQAELLQPLINRCFAIMAKKKLFQPAPESLGQRDIEIEYVSPLAKAQRASDVQSLLRMVELSQPLAQIDPAVMDYIDMDGLAKHLIKVLSIPAVAIRSDEEVEGLRQERMQQQEQQMAMAQEAQQLQSIGQAAPAIQALQGGGG